MKESLTITHQLWNAIDKAVEDVMPIATKIKDIKERESGPWEDANGGKLLALARLEAERNKMGGIGRGLAIALHLLTQPAFPDSDAVVKHAQLRYRAAKNGESIETPGIRGSGAAATSTVARESTAAADDAEPSPAPTPAATPEPATDDSPPAPSAPDAPSTPGTESPATETAASGATEPIKAAPKTAPRKRKASAAPTPEVVLDQEKDHLNFDPNVAGPNTKMSVNEALARAAKRREEVAEQGLSGDLTPGHGEHTAEEIAAMIAGLDDE